MSIDNRCKEQQTTAKQMVIDFKHTKPGSNEQLRALITLSFLVGMWSDFLKHEVERMDFALELEANI